MESTLGTILAKHSGYKYQVTFSKKFSGKNYTLDNQILRFVDWGSANDFAECCDGKTVITSCTGNDTFVRINPILEAI